jgi:hypothetical protein
VIGRSLSGGGHGCGRLVPSHRSTRVGHILVEAPSKSATKGSKGVEVGIRRSVVVWHF